MPVLSLRPDLITHHDVIGGLAEPNDPEYAWHLLAEGDSWFSLGALPSSNLLFEMRFRKWTQVLTLARPGDTLLNMSDLAANAELKRHLSKKNFCHRFHGLLLSGGGNDVIDAAGQLISRTRPLQGDGSLPEHFVDLDGLERLLKSVQEGHARIVALRDSKHSRSQNAPAFVHTYDYATPRNAPARFVGTVSVLGPWLFKAFDGGTVDPKMQQRIADLIMDRLAEALLALDSDNASSGLALPSFHVIDTRNTLVRANATEVGNSNDWLNEIHPNLDGYRKVADKLSLEVDRWLV
jgi:hypothetical protein